MMPWQPTTHNRISTRFKAEHEAASANPADVKAVDAARVKLAGQIRGLIESDRVERGSCEPFTLTALDAAIGVGRERLLDAIKLLSLVSWRMQREGDSQPVEVWGTLKQLGAYATTLAKDEGCDLSEALGVSDRLLARALRAAP